MKVTPFKLERFFAQYEFAIPYMLGSSDCEALSMSELLDLADQPTRELWQQLRLGYTESLGLPLLREEIAHLYRGISAHQVLVLAPTEAIFLAMQTLLEPGDHVICTFPTYQCLYQVAEDMGCSVSRWLPHEEDSWRFDPEDLRCLLRPNTRLVVCNFPHNPTGCVPTLKEFQQILEIATAHGARFFSDEIFRLSECNTQRTLPAAVELNDRAISLAAMSKVYGLAGLRLGWLVTHDRSLIEQLAQRRDYTTICTSAPSELLSVIALRAREAILSRQRRLLADNLARLDSLFAHQTERLQWTRPQGGTVCFPRLVGGPSATQLSERALEAGVLVLSSELFDYGNEHIRIGFGRRNMPEALARFEEVLDRCK